MDDIDELFRKLEPILKKKTKGLWYLNLFSGDKKADRENLQLLKLLADKKIKIDYQKNIRLPPPSEEKLIGEYHIGSVIYPDKVYSPFGLKEDEFIKHILIVGMTGTGKTNLSFHLLKELNKHDKPFLVFDWKKSYRDLKQLDEFKDLRIIRLGDMKEKFRFNPLMPPPGVNAKHWMTMLIDIMKHAFFVGHGVEYFFRKGIDHLYLQFGIYSGKKYYPTFVDLEKSLQNEYVRGREMLWMSAVKRVLAVLTFSGLLGQTLNVRSHKNIEDLLSQNVIIEMDNLASVEKIFFIESFMLWLYEFRKLEGKREKFKHAVVIEEAHQILSGAKEIKFGEETIIESVIRMVREFGQSVIVIDQEPTKLSRSIIANTNCKICLNLGNGDDIQDIGRSMSLEKDQIQNIDRLKVGHAIVKMKERFIEPIHIKIPHVKLIKGKKLKKTKSVGIP
jgi:type IV secretory pathway VirB4 component